MRRDEKSDEAVVPEKQANKAAEAAAELVEGRASAKRIAEQRSAVRTQSRGTASQGLGSVRKAARKHRSARFTNRKVNWILDADIQSFFDRIDHDWMMRFMEHRMRVIHPYPAVRFDAKTQGRSPVR